MVTYKKQSLFDAPKESVLVHACNAQGVWGSGIAKEFKTRFPKAYDDYHEACINYPMIGEFTFIKDNDYFIGGLITSKGYSNSLDDVESILVHTTVALNELCLYLEDNCNQTVYSNKFNSGLFNVPWQRTETILKVLCKQYNINWIVCDPNLEEIK